MHDSLGASQRVVKHVIHRSATQPPDRLSEPKKSLGEPCDVQRDHHDTIEARSVAATKPKFWPYSGAVVSLTRLF
jgi:hypothetical protein